MLMLIGGMELTVIRKVGGNMLIGAELRETMTLFADAAGESLDAINAALTPDACRAFTLEGEEIAGYGDCIFIGIDRREGEQICIMLARPSELRELRTAISILTGEAE